jgi:retron-type reverse transcriptase
MNDFERLCDFDNLYAAHRAARLGKRHKKDVIAFEMDLANQLCSLRSRLEDGSYALGGYQHFMIHDPKEREIQALSYADRVVQHSLCDNVLAPLFERRLIFDNCACRKGKGTSFGIGRLSRFMGEHFRRHGAQGYFLKADVRKYFLSIDHEVLLARLRRVIPDPRIMALLSRIVQSFHMTPGKGLPMGNQTSQWFALFYLDPVDRLIKEKLQVRHYSRYMDDMVLLHPDRDFLQACRNEIVAYCGEALKLELNQKTQTFPLRHGVDYLGWHFYLSSSGKVIRELRTSAKQRLKRRLRCLQHDYAKGRVSLKKVGQRIASGNGHLAQGHTWRLRERVYGKTVFSSAWGAAPNPAGGNDSPRILKPGVQGNHSPAGGV